MQTLQQLILDYQVDLKQNRLSYSDHQLHLIKEDLKRAYQTLKEENKDLHQDGDFMHAYKSAHGLIQHELRERDLDRNLTIDDIFNDTGETTFRDHYLKRAERKIRHGDYSHVPAEYRYLCDVVEAPSQPTSSTPAVQRLRSWYAQPGHADKFANFKQFVVDEYTPCYQHLTVDLTSQPVDFRINNAQFPVAVQLAALEELVDEADNYTTIYNAETAVRQWVHNEAGSRLLKEDFSGLNRQHLISIRQNVAKKRLVGTGTADLVGLPVVRRGERQRAQNSAMFSYAIAAGLAATVIAMGPSLLETLLSSPTY